MLKKLLPSLFLSAVALAFLNACDDSSSANDSVEVSSSSTTIESSSDISDAETPEVPETPPTLEEPTETPSTTDTPITQGILPDADGFYAIADVYKNLRETDKVAFLLRHAERIDDLGQEATLTEVGEEQSYQTGVALAGSEPFYYASSGFVRTTETCRLVALGRGETNVEVVAWDGLDGNYFVLDTALFNKYSKIRGGAWKVLARWAYTGSTPDALYDLQQRGDQYINEVILPAMNSWEENIGFLSSHDVLLMPLTVYATKGTIDLKFHENGRWIKYLAGIAIIQEENGNVILLPIKALESGIMGVNG